MLQVMYLLHVEHKAHYTLFVKHFKFHIMLQRLININTNRPGLSTVFIFPKAKKNKRSQFDLFVEPINQ